MSLAHARTTELDDLRGALDEAIRRHQKAEFKEAQLRARFNRLRHTVENMIDDNESLDDFEKGRREGWNVAVTAILSMLNEDAT